MAVPEASGDDLTPCNWPEQTVQLNDAGLALVLLALSDDLPRPMAREHARHALRKILAGLLQRPADDVNLREDARGPVLDGFASPLRISLSYAPGHCLIGLAAGRALGVDIVRIDALPETTSLTRLFLPALTRRAVLAAPPAARDAAFARGWAEMEARSKCLGLPLTEMDAQRERALSTCNLAHCTQIADYRIALATAPL